MKKASAERVAQILDQAFLTLTGLKLQKAASMRGFQTLCSPVAQIVGVTNAVRVARFWKAAQTKQGLVRFFEEEAEPTLKEWREIDRLAPALESLKPQLRFQIIKRAAKLLRLPRGRPQRPPQFTLNVLHSVGKYEKAGRSREEAKAETADKWGCTVRTVERILAEERRSQARRPRPRSESL